MFTFAQAVSRLGCSCAPARQALLHRWLQGLKHEEGQQWFFRHFYVSWCSEEWKLPFTCHGKARYLVLPLLLGHTAPFLLQTSTLAFCASVLSAASQDSEAKRQGADAAVRGLPCCQSPDASRQQFCKAGERNEPGRCPMDALPCPDHVSFPDLSSPCPDLFYCSSPLCCVERDFSLSDPNAKQVSPGSHSSSCGQITLPGLRS